MRRTLLVIAATVTSGVLLAGCAPSGAQETAVAGNAAGQAAPAGGVTSMDAAQFRTVAEQPGVRVIDVRTPEEFAAGHLPGAVNIDVQSPDFAAQVAALDKAATYAVYCRSGNRSKAATAQMADAGITTIYELDAGIADWAAAGFPIVQ
jgi:rhodanese-related sulfurtransferase